MLDWLRFFRRNGVPGGARDLGIAQAAADTLPQAPFLVFWYLEGGWDGYSMFNPVATRNDAIGTSTFPTDQQLYRPTGVALQNGLYPVQQTGAIRYGHLAASGSSLFPDMAIVSSHRVAASHSSGRLASHMGTYSYSQQAARKPDERTVLQAFCEVAGQSYLMPHISWHRWLSDGELAESSYPEGTGYYEKLGPEWAHTIYGGTPTAMRQRISQIAASAGGSRDAAIHAFVDNLHNNFLKDKNGESVKAFASAVEVHRTLASKGANLDITKLFTDTTLRSDFGIVADDEKTTATEVNGNPARSKNSPNTNVQALMAYELMTKGVSNAFWIESRQVRGFDDHSSRASTLQRAGQVNQKTKIDSNLWTPLKAFVSKLKGTPYGGTGKSYFDHTTIVIASEMGRSMNGGDEDVCQHWSTGSVAFLGGNVKGNTQFGGVGTVSLDGIPILPDGTLDPAYDATTGSLRPGMTKDPKSFLTDVGNVYATALDLCGIPKASQTGKNTGLPLAFVKK